MTASVPSMIEWFLPAVQGRKTPAKFASLFQKETVGTGIVLTSLTAARGKDAPEVKRRIAKPYIPYGVTHFRGVGDKEWLPVGEFPEAWRRALYGLITADDDIDEEEERRETERIWKRRKKGS